MVVTGEEVEIAIGLDRVGRAGGDAEVALHTRVPVDGLVVRGKFEVRQNRVDQTIGPEFSVQEIAANPDDAQTRRLRDQLMTQGPNLIGPALADLHRPSDRGGDSFSAERLYVPDRLPVHRPQPLLASIEFAVRAGQVARLHRGLVLFADQADQRAGVRIHIEDLFALVRYRSIIDRDHPDVVAPACDLSFKLVEV